MNAKQITGLLFIILMVTSGPLALPLALASSNPSNNEIKNEPSQAKVNVSPTNIILNADNQKGSSPLFVNFTGSALDTTINGGIQAYLWDFDGDGINDYANLDTGSTTHVYLVNKTTKQNAIFTVLYNDGSIESRYIPIQIDPINTATWHEIKNLGLTKFGIKKDGSIVVFDEKNWIKLEVTEKETQLLDPLFEQINETKSRLSYPSKNGKINLTIKYGLAGRAEFIFTRTDANNKPEEVSTDLNIVSKNNVNAIGRLNLDNNARLDKFGKELHMDAGNHDPWRDTGLVPYGEYFNKNSEYVSTSTGCLSIVQNDINVPGRGLDLVINRVYAPPVTWEGAFPANSVDYSYQEYPWAPVGNSWMLGFPWIETENGDPTYIRLSNGQRYEWNTSSEYHSGDHFKTQTNYNNSIFLYTVDGTRHYFDAEFKLQTIKDTNGNKITFDYNQNDTISKITDTIGREYDFRYTTTGYVSNITNGNRVWKYYYNSRGSYGDYLIRVVNPMNHTTTFWYGWYNLLKGIQYPSGGVSSYDYKTYTWSSYTRYRVKNHYLFDGVSDDYQHTYYDYGYNEDFHYVYNIDIHEKDQDETIKRTYLSYGQGNIEEYIYDGDDNLCQFTNKLLSDNRRRIVTEHYLGDTTSIDAKTIRRYDTWGNMVYQKNRAKHEQFYTYNNSQYRFFVDSIGNRVTGFTDSYYSQSPNENLRNLLIGKAEYQNGNNTNSVETYFKYTNEGNLVESKINVGDSWAISSMEHDSYGNVIKSIDPLNTTTIYSYSSNFSSAYLTGEHKVLQTETGNRTLSKIYDYYIDIGLLKSVTDEYGNKTEYEYDVIGRVTKQKHPEIDSITTERIIQYNDVIIPLNPSNVEEKIDYKIFYAQNRLWNFFYNASGWFYSSLHDGNTTWDSPKVWSVESFNDYYVDLEYLHLLTGDQKNIKYTRCTLNSDGTISIGTENQVFYSYKGFAARDITVTDNYVWISYTAKGSRFERRVLRSDDVTGGWSQTDLWYYGNYDNWAPQGKLVGLPNDRVCLILNSRVNRDGYLYSLYAEVWDGDSWNNCGYLRENCDHDAFGEMIAWGDDVYVFCETNYDDDVFLKKVDCASELNITISDSVFVSFKNDVNSFDLVKGDLNHTFYCIWSEGGFHPTHVTRYYNGSSLGMRRYSRTDLKTLGGIWPKTPKQLVNGDLLRFCQQQAASGIQLFNLTDMSDYISSVQITDENNQRRSSYYDGLGRLIRNEKYNGSNIYSTEYYSYDWSGQVAKFVDADSNVYLYDYDVFGNLVKTVYPDESYSSSIWNYTGNSVKLVNEEGNIRQLYYDPANRLIQVDETNGTDIYSTYYDYDLSGNLVNLTDAKGTLTSYTYNTRNLIESISHPDGLTEYYSYDSAGRLNCSIDRNGVYTKLAYDTLGRLVNQSHFKTGSLVSNSTYQYYDTGLPKSQILNQTRVSFEYDARSRLIKESTVVAGNEYSVSYQYDNCSNIVGVIYPDSSEVNLSYDPLNRFSSISNYADFTYTLTDQVDTIEYANGVSTSYTYDHRNRPTDITVTGSGILLDLTYTYDKSGSVTSINNGTYTEYYTYDLLDRLNSTTGPWSTIDYSYDPVGNRLSRGVQGGSTTSYSYDSMDRMLTATGMGFDWDGNGNMLYRHDGVNAWNYTYDPVNRLTRVMNDGVLSARYTYDAAGRRVRSWDTVDGTVDYVYSGLNIIDEISGGVHEKHVYAGGMHIASNTSGVIEYYHVDHLGSTRLKTAENGSAIYESNYEPFGPSSGESGSEDYRYTGKQEDLSGLYYFGARYYDPLTGRFTTRDTMFGELGGPQSQNRYVYCMNNPHKYVDPDGHSPEKALEFILHIFAYSLAYSTMQMIDAAIIRPRDVSDEEVVSWYIDGGISGGFSYGNTQVTPSISSSTGLDPDGVNTALRAIESTGHSIYTQYTETGEIDYSVALDAGMKSGLITYSSRHILPSGAAHNDPLRFMMVVGIKKGVSNAMRSIEDYTKPTTEVINAELDYQIAFNDYLYAERRNHERRGYVG